MIADNRLAEKAGWDSTLLALELQELSLELNLDVTVTGFEMAEIDLIVGEAGSDKPDEADVILPNAVRLALEHRRELRDKAPPVHAARACQGARCPRAAASARTL